MSTPVIARPTLREVILDSLNDAYWSRRANVEECRACARQPAGICPDHQEDNALAREYEEARKQIERSPGDAEVLAVFAGLSGTEGGEGQ